MSTRLRTAAVVLALLASALGAYWYWSPLLVVRQMHAAARTGDARAFNHHVDYPRLRESLKDQLALSFGWRPSGGAEGADGGLGGLGAVVGRAVTDRLVDAMVRPEVVMRVMQAGRMALRDRDRPPDGASAPSDPRGRLVWSDERPDADRYIVYALREGAPPAQRIGLVFERSGFAHWRLVELRLAGVP